MRQGRSLFGLSFSQCRADEGDDFFCAVFLASLADEQPGRFAHLRIEGRFDRGAELRLQKSEFERRNVRVGEKRVDQAQGQQIRLIRDGGREISDRDHRFSFHRVERPGRILRHARAR